MPAMFRTCNQGVHRVNSTIDVFILDSRINIVNLVIVSLYFCNISMWARDIFKTT